MTYYQLALLGSPLESLTYHFDVSLTIGLKVSLTLSNRETEGVVLAEVEKPDFKTNSILNIFSFVYSESQIKIAQFMAEYYGCSVGEALGLFVPFVDPPSFPSSSLGMQTNRTHSQAGAWEREGRASINITLSPTQTQALDFIRSHSVSLLFGDTGAGKSEIYMRRMDESLSEQKRCLLLLPEISLTPQMEKRFSSHFGDAVVLWHSKMTPKQKKVTLEKIHNGSAHIIVGPRSALFLPIKDLGLIVVDEEHDESYKSSSRPRYHARDMAIYMGTLLKIPVVLGSATPSLSSYAKYPFFRLRGGYFSSKREFIFEPSIETLSPFLDAKIKSNYDAGHQGIVFIPTRANFKTMVCESCGTIIECPFCSVGMSLHRNARALKCHYCNYTEVLPNLCPKCQSKSLTTTRLGTAEAVEHFTHHFSDMKIQQFDRDVITTQNKLIKVLEAFNAREIDLLVGTQMLSKGHDYHDIALAVVMGIDNLLAQSDYRSRERALSLLIQIAGRSGRKNDSIVIVQSCNESFFRPFLEDYELFLKEELKLREGRYPPHKKLARLLFAHKNGVKAKTEMERAVGVLQTVGLIDIVGFGASPIEKIADKYRFQILLRSDKVTSLIRAIKHIKSPLCEIDMDPIEFT
ncbi:MAG: primosomal protein N' [Sulfuricurvum sp.]|uniref:primosomal protein N' n=1 Tax=Sulfuricurvum sp. TaxID=2025608 RepID=UPI00260B1203|nr:primosomal protein N' [Sulfuricurvum sp.]MDD2828574.1 primosomal protein N' [Sulfuricurvum sp.]MDD4948251.1 primosomal protein N' [Sulfuricurvum sp.]